MEVELIVERGRDHQSLVFSADEFVIAGWTGRNRAAMEGHIRELESIGVRRPTTMPVYYRNAASRLTTHSIMEVLGNASSGEVEFVLFQSAEETFVGVGSDHTDRKVETYGIAVSKQICDKPIASMVWPLAEVERHWDDLELRAYIIEEGGRVLYQEGSVSSMLSPQNLIKGYSGSDRLRVGTVMFGGTLPALGGVRPAHRFEGEIFDPRLDRKISFGYEVRVLPIPG